MKYQNSSHLIFPSWVAPCAGAGIEMKILKRLAISAPGRPLRGGGD